ncbi:MAG: histidinol-phosphate transaminase [Planctomycetota bacterium]
MPVSRRAFVAGVSSLSAVALGGWADEVRGETSVGSELAPARILFNENPLGPSPKAIAALQESVQRFARYPLGDGPQLLNRLRKMHGLPYEESSGGLSLAAPESLEGSHDLVLGVGSSELLRAAAWCYGGTDGTIVEPYPSYSAIGSAAAQVPGSTVERVRVPLDGNNKIDTKAMIAAIDSDTRIVVICNPNNPTGTTLSPTEIEAITDAAPADALVFIDEAYIEFLDDPTKSAVEFAKTRDNVLLTRTFSKIHGLAGLRLGYGLGSIEVIERIKPYLLGGLSMNMPGVLASIASLDAQDHIDATLKLTRETHQTWAKGFRDAGYKMTPTVTCFCWVDLLHDCNPLVEFLAKRDVLISGGGRWDLPNFVRISTGTPEENDRLLAGIRAFKKL